MSSTTPMPPGAEAARVTPTPQPPHAVTAAGSGGLSSSVTTVVDEIAAAVNYVDVKVHKISSLPPSLFNESGNAPMFSDHPFRYELTLSTAASSSKAVAGLTNGRLLTPVPLYEQFIASADLAPIEIGPMDSTRAGEVPSDIRVPPRVVSTNATPLENEHGGHLAGAAAGGASPVSASPEILWVLAPECDATEWKELEAAKKDAKPAPKGAKGGAPAAASPTADAGAAVKLTLPLQTAPPPCVVRQLLSQAQQQELENCVEQGLPLIFHFRRILRSNAPPEWEDLQESRYAGVVSIPLSALREPGATTFTVTVPLQPAAVEVAKDDEKAGGGTKKKAAPAKKTKGGGAPSILTDELDANEPHPYVQNQTSVTVTVTFRQALTRLPQSRPRPNLQPTDLIPTRLRPPRRPLDATKTFSVEVESLTQRIVKEYREHVDATGQTGEEGRSGFLNYLQSSGQAHAYRQVLIPAVQAVVKEKFLRQPNPSKEELNRVTNELYQFLTDTMHATIHRVFHQLEQQHRAARASDDGLSASERWKRRAMEAEVMKEFGLAAKYHQERLGSTKPDTVGDESLPNVWVEYAEFGLRVRDPLKAEQAFREALAIDYAHLAALVGYGLLLLNGNRFQESEVFLQSAVDLSPNMLTWGSLALLFEMKGLSLADNNSNGGDAANDSKRIALAREAKYAITQATRYAESPHNTPSDVCEHVARRCIDLSLEDLANLCLVKCKPGDHVELLYAKCFYQAEQYDEAVGILESLTRNQPSATEPRMLLGDVLNAMGKHADAEHQYNAALRIDPYCGSGPSYVRLGNMCASMGKFRDALAAFISGAKVWPCGLTWLGVGISYYRLEDMLRAEQALNESNILNNLNPKTWGYLALLCLRQRREEEGDQALNQAVKLGLDDAPLIAEIGVEELRVGRANVAETCFRRSLAISDDPNTSMQLGRSLCVLRRFDEARDAFLHVAKTSSSEAQRLKAEEQAAIIPIAS